MPKDPRIKKVLVIGSGPIIIGQAAEFDYSGTQACRALKSEGVETVLVNSNPATIMTDPDIADHVYIEPLTAEVVERIIEKEKPDAILPNLGGQTGLNLSMELARSGFLDRSGVRLLACKPDTIDRAEDRQLFKDTMEKLHQPIIPSKVVENLDDALSFAEIIGYPVIVRPAFTMGGTGGGICEDRDKLHEIATNGLRLSPIHQILVEKCISGWKEIEYEVMRDSKGNVITVCNMENLDPVGIHTGDSIVVAPSQTLSDKEYQMLRTAALDIITELGLDTMTLPDFEKLSTEEIIEHLHVQDSERAFCVYEALKRGVPHDTIYDITKIDWWFLDKLQHLADMEMALQNGALTEEKYLAAKKLGFLDKTIQRLSGAETLPAHPGAAFKMVDTCAAEFAAKTPYFYSTCDADNEAAQFIAERSDPNKKKVLVFGSGPIRIGQGIEFDYCSVHAVWTLKKHGCEAVLVNNNPETVSTDFDTGDRLYFDPLNPESVDQIIATEKPDGCLVQFGGQTAIKLAKHMDDIGLPILGTPADAIDEAEDRERFDELLERCGIPRPEGRTVYTLEEALQAAREVGYPVLMRPSYVLGGQNMIVAYNSADVTEYMGVITKHVDMSHPVLMDKYILGTECEVDAICDGTDYLVPGIMQQVERTGVHSGDSICVYPPYTFSQKVIDTLVDYTGRFARELKVVGLVNVQYAVQNDRVYVIEVNPRSSRTVPYISKVTGVPMVDLAVRCTLGEKLRDMGYGTGLWRNGQSPYTAIKVPVYSFLKLHGVDTMLGPEMKSTGEVLGIAPNFHEAMMKGLVAAGYQFKTPGPGSCVIISVKDSDKPEAAELAWKLHDYGYKIYGTPGTAKFLNGQMVPCSVVRQMSEARPNVLDLLESGLVDYIISTSPHGRDPHRDSVKFRRKATELSIPTITAMDTARVLVDALRGDHDISEMELVDVAALHRDAAAGK